MMDFDDDGEPAPVIAPRRQKCINRKTKLHIVFDEKARRDFLTGFHKRKLQRKKAAQEELKSQLKAEKKRIKLESKQEYKKLVHSYKPIPELEKQYAKEFKVDDAKVSVLELDTDLLAETNFLIGRNKGKPKEVEVPEEIEDDGEELPGMELKTKKQVKKMIKDNAKVLVQQSKAFQTLNRIQKQKQKKKASKEKEKKMKIKAKIQKKKRGRNRNGP